MEDFLECFGGLIVAAIVFSLPLAAIASFVFWINPKVEVFVDQNLIYKGSDLCVNISSGGYTTTVKTSKFLCIFPDKSYTSKDVIVRTLD